MTRLCPSGAGPAWYPHSYIKSPRRCSTAMSSHAARFHVSGSACYVVLPGYGPCDSSKIGFARRSPSTGLNSAGVDGNSCDSGGGPRGGSISASAIWSIGRGRRAGAKGLWHGRAQRVVDSLSGRRFETRRKSLGTEYTRALPLALPTSDHSSSRRSLNRSKMSHHRGFKFVAASIVIMRTREKTGCPWGCPSEGSLL